MLLDTCKVRHFHPSGYFSFFSILTFTITNPITVSVLRSLTHYIKQFQNRLVILPLTDFQLSARESRLEVYCEKNLEKLHGISLESKYLVPAKTMEAALKKPRMRPFIKHFNVTSFAVKVCTINKI